VLDIRAFHWGDIDALGLPQEAQASEAGTVDYRAMAMAHAASGPAWAVTRGDQVLAIGGLQLPWETKARAWALISKDADKADWVFMVLAARRMLGQAKWLGIKRIEAMVRTNWDAGERMLKMLGFKEESVKPMWGPDGATYSEWVRFT
jgi:hypothetical protein